MPLDFPCTNCQRTVRVPDGSEGKKTACPKCGAVQRIPGQRIPGQRSSAPDSSENAPETPPVPQTPPAPQPPPASAEPPTTEPVPVSKAPPTSEIGSTGRAANPFSDEQPANPYASPGEAAQTRTVDVSGEAVEQAKLTLMGPAIATMIVAGISWLFNGGVMAIYLAFGAAAVADRPERLLAHEEFILFWSMIGGLVLVTLLTGVIFAAMSRALQLRNYGFVLTGFLLPALPFITSYCCLLALPFSIWGIVVLCNDSVKAAFRRP